MDSQTETERALRSTVARLARRLAGPDGTIEDPWLRREVELALSGRPACPDCRDGMVSGGVHDGVLQPPEGCPRCDSTGYAPVGDDREPPGPKDWIHRPAPLADDPHALGIVATFIALMRGYTDRIRNGRTLDDVQRSMGDEMEELVVELGRAKSGHAAGPDGVAGESWDICLCGIDLALLARPDKDDSTQARDMLRKADKWERHYSRSITRDRTASAD